MPKVFISYSSADRRFAEKLSTQLNTEGIDVWYDQWEIKVGDSIVQKINDGISSSDFLVVVLSKNSIKSKWVKEELASASIITISKGAFILPILLEKCDLPPLLTHRRYANFADDPVQAFNDLVSAIKNSPQSIGKETVSVSDEDKARLDAMTAILSLYIDGYDSGTKEDKSRIEAEVAEQYRGIQDKWHMSPSVYSFYIKICIEEKRIIHISEFLQRMVEFVLRHREVANDVFLWCVENVARG